MPRLSASSAIFNAGIDDGDQSQPSDLVERATADPDLTQPQRALKQLVVNTLVAYLQKPGVTRCSVTTDRIGKPRLPQLRATGAGGIGGARRRARPEIMGSIGRTRSELIETAEQKFALCVPATKQKNLTLR